MKVVILAGGLGTRLSEETHLRPKPMVEIGGKPILWHIMNIYASAGFDNFLIACGYKGEIIKEYFKNFFFHNSDLYVNLSDGSHDVVNNFNNSWRIGLIDTGIHTMTGGRILRLKELIGKETFMVTYGDGLGSIDIRTLVTFHQDHGKLATITAVRPPARFGRLELDGDSVINFSEKPQTGEGWINGGFFVFEPEVINYINGDHSILERETLESLSKDGQLMAFRHEGFWQPMDTLREKQLLESLWTSGKAPWKVW